MTTEYEDIFRFRTLETPKIDKEAKKNRMAFLITGKMYVKGFESAKLERIVPEDWKESYENLRPRTFFSSAQHKPLVRSGKAIQ